MSKKVIMLSFDDGREDTYRVAFHIMKKFNLIGTINVVTEFIENPEKYNLFTSCNNEAMTVQNLKEMKEYGWEIACHGHTHKNTNEDIIKNIDKLKEMELLSQDLGFASPTSLLNETNSRETKELVENNLLKYVRTGPRVRREGIVYTILTLLNNFLRNPKIFYNLNKRYILKSNNWLLNSVAVTKDTTPQEILYLIDKMKESESLILMFHSILNKSDSGYGKDKWYWDSNDFEYLCKKISENKSLKINTTMEWIKG